MSWEGRITVVELDFAQEFGEDTGFEAKDIEEAREFTLEELYNYVRNASPKELYAFLKGLTFQAEEYDPTIGYKVVPMSD